MAVTDVVVRACDVLEAAGFAVCRAASSSGPADLIAWDTTAIRFIRVQDATALDHEALRLLPRPGNASVELWRFPDRGRVPVIERL